MKNEKLIVGKIMSPHGIKGEIKVYPLTDDPERLTQLDGFYIDEKPYLIESSRLHNGSWLVKPVNINDRNAAEELKGFVSVERENASPLKYNEYYIEDLKGMRIIDTCSGKTAVVTDVYKTGSTNVIEYELEKKRYMIPFLNEYFGDVDVENSVMSADLSNGVME